MITLKALFSPNNLITEIVVNDHELQKKLDEFAELSNKIDTIEAELKELNQRFGGIAGELTPLLESAKDNALQTQNYLIFIKTKGFERSSYAYKEAFLWLLERVNPAMKNLVNQSWEATKKISKVAPKVAIQKNEGIGDIWIVKMIKTILKRIIPYIRHENEMIRKTNAQFAKAISKLRT